MDTFRGKYKLIGIGDFSHGVDDIWIYRIYVINQIIKNNYIPKIFLEDSAYGPNNIMTDQKIAIKSKRYYYRYEFPIMRYSGFRIQDSPTYLEFIKIIKKNNIEIYGIDSEDKYREKKMADNILSKMDNGKNVINLFFGHNSHVDDREIKYESPYKYTTGHYLKKKLRDKYCIILSSGLGGSIRFDGINSMASEIPFSRKYTVNQKIYKNIMNKKTGEIYVNESNLGIRTPSTFDNNIIVIDKNFPQIAETGWSYDSPEWVDTDLYKPVGINYLIIFMLTKSLALFQ